MGACIVAHPYTGVAEALYLIEGYLTHKGKRQAVRILRLGKAYGPHARKTDASLSSFGPNAHRMSLQISATSHLEAKLNSPAVDGILGLPSWNNSAVEVCADDFDRAILPLRREATTPLRSKAIQVARRR